MNIGIVGHEAAKFTPENEASALALISRLLPADSVLVSGRSPLGGIDVWAEEVADRLGIPKLIHPPAKNSWDQGFRLRNLAIAHSSDIVHVIVVRTLPEAFKGLRFKLCYHCGTTAHVKSGACWTARQAMKLGKPALWHLLPLLRKLEVQP